MKISSIVILLLATSSHAIACGPYPPIIPTPKFFTSNWDGLLSRDFYKQENLRLWQQLTSNRIPLKDIEQVVYKDDGELLNQIVYGYTPIRTDNLFYVYLQNTTDYELADFLCTAKNLEKRRNEINSPWYYPSSRETYDEVGDFQTIINICNSYKGTVMRCKEYVRFLHHVVTMNASRISTKPFKVLPTAICSNVWLWGMWQGVGLNLET